MSNSSFYLHTKQTTNNNFSHLLVHMTIFFLFQINYGIHECLKSQLPRSNSDTNYSTNKFNNEKFEIASKKVNDYVFTRKARAFGASNMHGLHSET